MYISGRSSTVVKHANLRENRNFNIWRFQKQGLLFVGMSTGEHLWVQVLLPSEKTPLYWFCGSVKYASCFADFFYQYVVLSFWIVQRNVYALFQGTYL